MSENIKLGDVFSTFTNVQEILTVSEEYQKNRIESAYIRRLITTCMCFTFAGIKKLF